MKPQKVFRNITDTMSGGLTADMTNDEYKDYSKIYQSAYKTNSLYTNEMPCSQITNTSQLVLCNEGSSFILKRILRRVGTNYVLLPVTDDFRLKNFRTTGYADTTCIIYILKGHSNVSYPFKGRDFYGMTPKQIMKRRGFHPDDYRLKEIDLSISDEYFNVDIKIDYEKPITIDPNIAITLRIYLI